MKDKTPPRKITLKICKLWGESLEDVQGRSKKGKLPFVRSMISQAILEEGWPQSVAAQEINKDRSLVTKQKKTWK